MEQLAKTNFFFSLQTNKKIDIRELKSNYDEFVTSVLSAKDAYSDRVTYRNMLSFTLEGLNLLMKQVQKKILNFYFICY